MKVAQLCVTLCDPMGCSLPGFSVQGILQEIILEWVLSLLQGIFPTQGSNPGLPHGRWIHCHWITRETQEYWIGEATPSPVGLPNSGIKPESPALQMDSSPPELPGNACLEHSIWSAFSSPFFLAKLDLSFWIQVISSSWRIIFLHS